MEGGGERNARARKKFGDRGLWYVRRFHSHSSAPTRVFNVALLLLAFAALFGLSRFRYRRLT